LNKVLFSSVAYFFIGSLIFGEFSFWAPVYSGYQSFIWCIASKYFLLLCGWSLVLRDYFFCAELFNFMKSHLSILCLSCWAPWVL
jgi:hypothetical protein